MPQNALLSFAPGKAYQFDWSQEVVLLSGVTSAGSPVHAAGAASAPKPVAALTFARVAHSACLMERPSGPRGMISFRLMDRTASRWSR